MGNRRRWMEGRQFRVFLPNGVWKKRCT
jgi:hypothetical protein